MQKDVEALCDVCNSGKVKKEGCIGEKGIGFKSVFRITSNPHVFSNGYSFRLPRHHEAIGLGYIVPCWVDHLPQEIEPTLTTIILPLDESDPDTPDCSFESLAIEIQAIASETLLFLPKLKRLRLLIEGIYEADLTKDESATPLVHLNRKYSDFANGTDGDTSVTYWVVTERFNRPEHVSAEHRKDVFESPVTVALPLEVSETPTANIFAYLPVCADPGLPFLVNADFLLVSSREATKDDEPWNIWLRGCVAETFVKAFSKLLRHETHRALAYSFIPTKTHHTLLKPLPETIHATLRTLMCIWCQKEPDLELPTKCRLAPKEFRDLFQENDIPEHLRLHPLVKPDIEPWAEQLKAIGVQEVRDDDVLECLGHREWLEARDPAWFVKCYSYLMQRPKLNDLDKYPIVPVDDGRPSNSSEQCIYFECDDETKALLDDLPQHARVPLAFLEPELQLLLNVHPDLKGWMANTLHISTFSRASYSVSVARFLESQLNGPEQLSKKELVQATEFLATFSDSPEKIKSIPVVLWDGTLASLAKLKTMQEEDSSFHRESVLRYQHVVTPEAADPETGWQYTFPTEADRAHLAILSDSYIHLLSSPDLRPALIKFFAAIGVSDAPRPRRHKKPCGYEGQEGYLTQHEKEFARRHRRESAASQLKNMTITNSLPPQWLSAEDDGDGKITDLARLRYRSLCRLLRKYLHADGLEHDYNPKEATVQNGLVTEVYYKDYCCYYPHEQSEFLVRVRKRPWFLTTQGLNSPESTFVDTEQVRAILGDTVPYALDKVPSNLNSCLSLRTQCRPTEIVDVLLEHSLQDSENVALAQQAFKFLASCSWLSESLVERLKNERLICAPTPGCNWFSVNDAIWTDRTDVFDDGFVYLETYYPKLKEFFVETLGVKEDADSERYARRWLLLQDAPVNDVEKIQCVLTPIYQELTPISEQSDGGEHLVTEHEVGKWWSEFLREAKVWCQNNSFCEPSRCYVPDDGELRGVFRTEQISFVWRPEKASFLDYEPLYRALNVPYLSESVSVRLTDQSDLQEVESPSYLTTGAVIWILACLKAKYPREYGRVIDIGLHNALWNTREYTAPHLNLEYSLDGVTRRKDFSAFWNRSDERLIHLGERTRKGDVAERLAKEILSDRRYKDFADQIEVAIGETEDEVRKRIRKRNWSIPNEVRDLLGDTSGHVEDTSGTAVQEEVVFEENTLSSTGMTEAIAETNMLAGSQSHNEDALVNKNDMLRGSALGSTPQTSEVLSSDPHEVDIVIEEQAEEGDECSPTFEFLECFAGAFHKPRTGGETEKENAHSGNVCNPDRRRLRTRQDIREAQSAEPHREERFTFVPVRHWEPKNELTRLKLKEWYGGRCQICGCTFDKRDGSPYFEGYYIVSRTQAGWVDRPGNVLCLCANCGAKFQHGVVETPLDIGEQVRALRTQAEGGEQSASVEIVLCGETVRMSFDERHLIDLQELMNMSGISGDQDT